MDRVSDYPTTLHSILTEKYRNADPEQAKLSDDAGRLIAFNGVYALSTSTGSSGGAFFAIDTNVHMRAGTIAPFVDVSLLVSLDGKHSYLVSFSGTFDGKHLKQAASASGFGVDLELLRAESGAATTASCTGTITLAGGSPISVSGVTYNNPIPYSVFEGTYYPSPSPDKKGGESLPVARIASNYQLSYDYGSGNGELGPVHSFTYNMNMFYFTFGTDKDTVQLIMGTSAGQGLACNNMYTGAAGQPISRSLVTIPYPKSRSANGSGSNAQALAALSGYYQLSVAEGAFLSVQGEYEFASGSIVGYQVKLGISLDGKSSTQYSFDDTMTFEDGHLVIPGVCDVTFTKKYDAAQRALTVLEGRIDPHGAVTGVNRFNPVPLTDFGGAVMSNSAGDHLTIDSDVQVTYNGKTMAAGIYVPIMYILAGAISGSEYMMSFGSGGLRGNACIVIPSNGETTIVSAIPAP